jgi:hypothetical protein
LPYNFLAVKVRRELLDVLSPFAAAHRHSFGGLCVGWSRIVLSSVAFDPLHFGVHPAGLLHLPHTSVRSQLGFSAPLQLAVKSFIVSVQLRE